MKKALIALLAAVGVLVIAVAAFLLWAWGNPLALHAWSTRGALDRAGLRQATAEVVSGRLHYWEAGTGPGLVFLHGAGDQAGAWSLVAPAFTDRYRVLVPDLPGHAGSDPAEGPILFHELLGGLEQFLESREEDRPYVLVGNSLGAWLSFLYARDHPGSVARIVAVNGGPVQGDPGDLTLTPKDREEARKLLAALRDPSSPPIPDWVLDDIVDQSTRGPIGRMTEDTEGMVRHLFSDEDLAAVEVPVDLLWGASDRLFPKDYVARLGRAIPRVRVTWVPECGHVPANECPSKFLNLLEEVLAMEPPSPKILPEEP